VTDLTQDLNSRIDKIEVTLSHAVDAIEKMASIVNAPQETKWGPILTAVSLLFVAGGGYTTLITMPMQREADQLRTQIYNLRERELDDARALGRIEGKLGVNLNE
jgi:hypothetical protein